MKFLIYCSVNLIRESFTQLLKSLNAGDQLQVLGARNSSEVTELQDQTPIDVCLFYLELNESGWNRLEELVTLASNMPIVVVADFTEDSELRRAIQLGANGCVSTDFSWRKVTYVIHKVLSGEISCPALKSIEPNSEAAAYFDHRPTQETATPEPTPVREPIREDAAKENKPRPATSVDHHLTPRQLDVLKLINEGQSNKQIARSLDMAEGTVKIHCAAIFRELEVTNRTQAALKYVQLFGG